uniref:Uncharacterized LOC100182967 n=1 Tax=Ciona intestinalis TaxID=7719 RepID=H2XP05_CIOIN|nr:uncharacterized protein LOC100182967 [Ciona intestinalis]|eukprot:XP_026689362.1 uncharacterized protein LOC100182967 [Ciona intestinalis]
MKRLIILILVLVVLLFLPLITTAIVPRSDNYADIICQPYNVTIRIHQTAIKNRVGSQNAIIRNVQVVTSWASTPCYENSLDFNFTRSFNQCADTTEVTKQKAIIKYTIRLTYQKPDNALTGYTVVILRLTCTYNLSSIVTSQTRQQYLQIVRPVNLGSFGNNSHSIRFNASLYKSQEFNKAHTYFFPQYEVGQKVYVQLDFNVEIGILRNTSITCHATPTSNAEDTNSRNLLQTGCRSSLRNLNTTEVSVTRNLLKFQFVSFLWPNISTTSTYIHCSVKPWC